MLDWRRRVAAIYADVRRCADPGVAHAAWRADRDELFAGHPDSPLLPEQRAAFGGLPCAPYDPALRFEVEVAEPRSYDIPTSGNETFSFTRVGIARFELAGAPRELELYWLNIYGGGLFVAFRDATSGRETYGGGRYLLDTVKGADLGTRSGQLVFDFNFAYNPSCAYDPRWVCPLAPPPNRLDLAVAAGERV